jgi:hypothetical protein
MELLDSGADSLVKRQPPPRGTSGAEERAPLGEPMKKASGNGGEEDLRKRRSGSGGAEEGLLRLAAK